MTEMSRQDWERFVRQWRTAGPELARIRRKEMRARAYDAGAVDAVLQVGDTLGHSRTSRGLVELQQWLKKLAHAQAGKRSPDLDST